MGKGRIKVEGRVVKPVAKPTTKKPPRVRAESNTLEEAKTVSETIENSRKKNVIDEIKPPKTRTVTKKPSKEIKIPSLEKSDDVVPIIDRIGPQKDKRFKEDKYYRIADTSPKEDFVRVGERVKSGELKWSFYTVINSVGYHYYLDINKTKK